ncbi:MAG: GMC oxidoreductase [Gammaproteobacteria bacterium]
MFIDSRELEQGRTIDTDICVIGAGAVGITLAREWIGKKFRVCLLESGGLDFDLDTQQLASTVNTGRDYPFLPGSRLRYFGGSTNHWGGHCLPIREYVFERRDWIPYSGWPFSRKDLDPYYQRAHEIIGLGEFNYNAQSIAESLGANLFPFDQSKVENIVARYNPLRFGKAYRDVLGNASNITIYLFANVTAINKRSDTDHVESLTVNTLAGKSFSVRAKNFILATGGIDNARILLLSNQVHQNGLGNAHDLVGRFFMEHVFYRDGAILPASKEGLLLDYPKMYKQADGYEYKFNIGLPEHVCREHCIPDFRTEIYYGKFVPDSVYSARVVRDSLAAFSVPDNFSEHISNIIENPRPLVRRKLGYRPAAKVHGYQLYNNVEQIPNPESRVTLSREKDSLGLNKAAVNWKLSEEDRAGIYKALGLVATEVGRSGFGRMRVQQPMNEDILLEGANGGAHHMGTTRMHSSPRYGVVDENCLVHGLKNLYISGSSVFPVCGYSNPTLTITALSVRLADYLNGIMASEGLT